MSNQAWIAVTGMPSRDTFLSVWLDDNLISPKPPGTNHVLRRYVSPGKHAIKIDVTGRSQSNGRHIETRGSGEFVVELSPGSDSIYVIKIDPEAGILMSYSTSRDPTVWPLAPEDIFGYSEERFTMIETSGEEDKVPFVTDAPRIIDNASDATVTRRIQLSQDWKRTYTIDTERSTKRGAAVNLGSSIGVQAGVQAEKTLSAKYGTSTEEADTYTEEVTVTVPPHSKVTLIIDWKLRVRKGILRYVDEAGFALIDVPFSVVTGVTFDQIIS